MGTGGDFVLTDKLNDLEDKIEELGRRSEAKYAEVKEENLNHNTRLGGVETEVQDIQEKLRAREELELVEAEQARSEQLSGRTNLTSEAVRPIRILKASSF